MTQELKIPGSKGIKSMRIHILCGFYSGVLLGSDKDVGYGKSPVPGIRKGK